MFYDFIIADRSPEYLFLSIDLKSKVVEHIKWPTFPDNRDFVAKDLPELSKQQWQLMSCAPTSMSAAWHSLGSFSLMRWRQAWTRWSSGSWGWIRWLWRSPIEGPRLAGPSSAGKVRGEIWKGHLGQHGKCQGFGCNPLGGGPVAGKKPAHLHRGSTYIEYVGSRESFTNHGKPRISKDGQEGSKYLRY